MEKEFPYIIFLGRALLFWAWSRKVPPKIYIYKKKKLWKTIRNYFWPGTPKLHHEIIFFPKLGARKCTRLPIYLLLRLLRRCFLMNSVEILHDKVFCKFWVIWPAQQLKIGLDSLISCDNKTFCYLLLQRGIKDKLQLCVKSYLALYIQTAF